MKNNTGKIAYISGPMTGLSNLNFDNFQKGQEKLEKDGYIVMNPHEIGKEIYKKWSLNPAKNAKEEKIMWQEFMKEDIKHLTLADAVFLLPNWETSKGSRVELFIAQQLGINIYYLSNYEEFDISFQLIKGERVPL